MRNSCPKIDFGRQFWYFFPNRLYSQIVNCKKFSVMGESPAIFFFAGIWENIFFHFLEAFVSLRWLVF